MPLCTFEMSIQDVLRLAGTCGDQLPGLVRCGSGGRNHIPCCQRRGVNEACLNLCAGMLLFSLRFNKNFINLVYPKNLSRHCGQFSFEYGKSMFVRYGQDIALYGRRCGHYSRTTTRFTCHQGKA